MRESIEVKKKLYVVVLIAFGFILNTIYSNFSNRSKLDNHYLERLKEIKSRMIYGSPADTMKDLDTYQDQTELCMHLDGYNGIEIMKIRCKAFAEAINEKKNEK